MSISTRGPKAKQKPKVFYLECVSDPKEIGKIEPFLLKVNEIARLDDGTFYRLLVAATEAVNNGILHANKSDPTKFVSITCILKDHSLVFRVKDQGRGFDPAKVPNPLDEKNLLKTSGRGIFLMRSLMDDVIFDIAEDGMQVELVVNLKLLK